MFIEIESAFNGKKHNKKTLYMSFPREEYTIVCDGVDMRPCVFKSEVPAQVFAG